MLTATQFLAALDAARLEAIVIGADTAASIVVQPVAGADVPATVTDDIISRFDWHGPARAELVHLLAARATN